ncbi:MAG TPA: RHS repeat-associated core domain-containing protein, partial [Alphaproteobacteria bacterium]|nr:RHS repeat-associated core domain-containing protein [Alphaproteobacteria bacterium]
AYAEDGRLLGVYAADGTPVREYVYLGRLPVAVVTSNGSDYIHTDHLGTPRAVSEPGGPVVWKWISDPFGVGEPDQDPDGDGSSLTLGLRFPGQYADAEIGLHYNYHRYYDPETGRYLTSDPIGLEGGMNTYAYADGSPTMKTDPLGLATYMCTRRLNNFPFRVGPLYHQYVCTGNADDGYSCGGLGPTGNMFDSPGQIERDDYKADRCNKKDSDNQCIESCIAKKLNSPPPNYSVDLSQGQNCQTYANSVVYECEATCHAGQQ